MSTNWVCPICQTSCSGHNCSTCHLNHNVVQFSTTSECTTVLDTAESIFMKCVWYHTSSPHASDELPLNMNELSIKIQEFIQSTEVSTLNESNWKIRDALYDTLRSALRGKKHISLLQTDMDRNSISLYAVFVARVRNRLEREADIHQDDSLPVVDKPVIPAEETWPCPICKRLIAKCESSCSTCDVRQDVIDMATIGTAAPLLESVESVFMKCVDHYESSSENNTLAHSELVAKVEDVLSSADMVCVIAANWHIKDLVAHLLRSILGNEKQITFSSHILEWIDVNSTALFTILVDRINEKLENRSLSARYSVQRPLVFTESWCCPCCGDVNAISTQECPACAVHKKVISICKAGNVAIVIHAAYSLFMACVDFLEGEGCDDARRLELTETGEALLSSEDMTTAVQSGWNIKDSIAHLLRSIISGIKHVTVNSSIMMDKNSTALYMLLVDRINENLNNRKLQSIYSVERPVVYRLEIGDTWACPSCSMSAIPSDTNNCPACNTCQNVLSMSTTGQAAPVLRSAEKMFMECIDFQENCALSSVEKALKLDELTAKVETLLLSPEMASTVESNWLIKDAVAHLLRSALEGTKNISFTSSSWMDLNSTALYKILATRINCSLDRSNLSGSYVVECPDTPSMTWTCPGCKSDIPNATAACGNCNVQKRVVSISCSGQVSPLLQSAESVFLSCVESQNSDEAQFNCDVLAAQIENILTSELMNDLLEAGWHVQGAFAHVLRSALKGEKLIELDPTTWADEDDYWLTTIFVDRIECRLKASQDNASLSQYRFNIPPVGQLRWACPLCCARVSLQVEKCECGVDKKVTIIARLKRNTDLFNRAKHIIRSIKSIYSSEEDFSVLTDSIESFLNSSEMWDLESRNFHLRDIFIVLFHRLMNRMTTSIDFDTGAADINSRALYGTFIRWFQSECDREGIELHKALQMPCEEAYVDLSKQQFPVPTNAMNLLLRSKTLILCIAKDIVGNDDMSEGKEHREGIDMIVEKLQNSGWCIRDAVQLMRFQVRDLDNLTNQCDQSSKAVIEAIYRFVLCADSFKKESEVPFSRPKCSTGSDDESEEDMLRRAIAESLKVQPDTETTTNETLNPINTTAEVLQCLVTEAHSYDETEEDMLRQAIAESLKDQPGISAVTESIATPNSAHTTVEDLPSTTEATDMDDLYVTVECRHQKIMSQPSISRQSSGQDVPKFKWEDIESIVCDKNLGQGSYGIVVEGTWKKHTIAIKVLRQVEGVSYDQCVDVAMKEVDIIMFAQRNIVNKNSIICVHGIVEGEIPDSLCHLRSMTMKSKAVGIMMRKEKQSLDSLLHSCEAPRMDFPFLVYLLKIICDVMMELHEVCVVHGDLKPKNILVTHYNPPEIRLIDFGNADVKVEDMQLSATMNFTANKHGTRVYSAPEMLNPRRIAKASRVTDVYAFGIIMWEVLSRQKPANHIDCKGNTFEYAVASGARPSLCELHDSTPQSLVDLLTACWHFDANKRPSFQEIFAVLSHYHNVLMGCKFDIFFSHAYSSKAFLSHVYCYLSKIGFRVWYDENEMGYNLERSMVEGIQNSTVFMACINRTYQCREFCRKELQWALDYKKPIVVLVTEEDPSTWANSEIMSSCRLIDRLYVDLSSLATKYEWENMREEVDQDAKRS
mmetsp:Transcript_5198/g.7998  ORF Transcript_5198/g.7998 Transcript_5198/m.7998 type:complete len:1640 (-) Transcript_5198:13-4932(-)